MFICYCLARPAMSEGWAGDAVQTIQASRTFPRDEAERLPSHM